MKGPQDEVRDSSRDAEIWGRAFCKEEKAWSEGLNQNAVDEGTGQEIRSERELEAGSHGPLKDFEFIGNVMGSHWLPNWATQCEKQTLRKKGWQQGDLVGNYCDSPKGRP